MPERDYESAYLAVVKNPLIYQDDAVESASVILRACATALDVTRAGLWILNSTRTDMDCLSLYDSRTNQFESGALLSEAQFPKYFAALFNGRVIDASDAVRDPRTRELAETYLEVLDVRSLLDATIRNTRNGELEGVLCVEMVGAQREWTVHDRSFAASMSDLLSQRLVTSEWARSAKNYQALYESSNEGIIVFKRGLITDANPAACAMFGYELEDMDGMSPLDLSPELQPDGQSSKEKAEAHVAACMSGSSSTFEWQHHRLDGSKFDAEITLNNVELQGENTMFGLVRDITEKKEAERRALITQEELEYRASHDSLTHLLNREQLHGHVEKLIAGVQHPQHRVALLLLDLNRFKEVNDTLGHATGDKVLIGLAGLLKARVESLSGSLFRLGGDEFVATFDSETCPEPFDWLVQIIRDALKSPFDVDGVSFEMSASIGAALYPDNGNDSHELLRCADVAMYHGKNHDGVSPWYSSDTDAHSMGRLSLINDLRRAIRQDELILHFQPRIMVGTGELTGCEALIRWEHPEQGLLPPGDFLPIAEMSELIHPLADVVLNKAFAQICHLRSLGYHVPVAVNLSARNISADTLVDLIETRLIKDNISPELLEVEITESALINNPQRALQNLRRLEKLGVSIAIDDFGTGYSSLRLLKELPFDTLKIDRSFVNDMLSSDPDRVIVSSTISLAHNFSAKVVAEGVEDEQTLRALESLKCEEAQGYFIARPMPAEQFEVWLADQRERTGRTEHPRVA